jgi:hypothetical protein
VAKAEGIVSFQIAGMALALYPRHELAKDANVAADGQGLGGISLAYDTRNREEVDSVVSEARAADAAILKPARQAFGAVIQDISLIRTNSCGRSPGILVSP